MPGCWFENAFNREYSISFNIFNFLPWPRTIVIIEIKIARVQSNKLERFLNSMARRLTAWSLPQRNFTQGVKKKPYQPPPPPPTHTCLHLSIREIRLWQPSLVLSKSQLKPTGLMSVVFVVIFVLLCPCCGGGGFID